MKSTASRLRLALVTAVIGATAVLAVPALAAVQIGGTVLAGGGPVANAMVTLWAASAAEPRQLGSARTGADGGFALAWLCRTGPKPLFGAAALSACRRTYLPALP